MSIADHFTAEFTVQRMVWITDEMENEYSELSTVGTFSGHVQQAAMELAQNLGLAFTKTFTVWCPLGTDVEEGDRLTHDDFTYYVRAKQTFEIGDNKHIELHCERDLTADDES